MLPALHYLHPSTGTSHDSVQRKSRSCTTLLQPHTVLRSKNSPEVYKIDKLYVGLLRELPPPTLLQQTWDQSVRSHLEEHLCQATSTLPKSLRDEEVITELIFCMAGRKYLPASTLLKPNASCLKDPVALNPTVWVFCGSRKCRRKVSEALHHLTYLDHFLQRFSMEAPYVSLHAPWPAGKEHQPQPQDLRGAGRMSMAIQSRHPSQTSICGARARFVIETSDRTLEYYSTIGGFLFIDGSVYAITSAHAMMNGLCDIGHSASEHDTEPTSSLSSDTESSYEASSDEESKVCDDSLHSAHGPETLVQSPSPEAQRIVDTEEEIWSDLPLPLILAYLSRGTTKGYYYFPDLAPSGSDFALVDTGSVTQRANEYFDIDRNTLVTISDHIPTRDLSSGDVWICGNAPIKGYLLGGDASIILRGTIMRTKRIQVALLFAHGLSGSWVVREGKLCGVIYAAYDRSPYLHMLPAEEMFHNIAGFLRTSVVRVANTNDIEDSYKSAEIKGKQTITTALQQDISDPSRQIHMMPGDPGFSILDDESRMEASAFENEILGAFIREPLSPSTKHFPEKPAAYTSHYLQEGSVTDFVLEGALSRLRRSMNPLTSIGQFSVSGSLSASLSASRYISGRHIRYKRIQHLNQFWAQLRDDPDVKRTMKDWTRTRGGGPVCLVIGIMICEDVEISTDAEETQERKAQGEIPVGEILLPPRGVNRLGKDANTKPEATSSSHTATLFRDKNGESSIFAVELKKVTPRGLRQKLLRLKGERPPKFSDYRSASMYSDQDSDEEASADEDLMLAELDAETLEYMLDER